MTPLEGQSSLQKPIPVAVLLGYSTTGKSTLSDAFEALRASGKIDIRDTDKEIGAVHGGHIYNVYLALVQGSNCALALADIEARERDFLRTFVPLKPTLVVAGPNLVVRDPEWGDFLRQWTPRSFYLSIECSEVYAGLMYRYVKEHGKLGDRPAFGSWNEGGTSQYDARTLHWELVSQAKALDNISKNMKRNVERYEDASDVDDRVQGGPRLRSDAVAQARLIERIRTYLGV